MAKAVISNRGITIYYDVFEEERDEEEQIEIQVNNALEAIGWSTRMLDDHTLPESWQENRKGICQIFRWKIT
jgi:hypothetical protein